MLSLGFGRSRQVSKKLTVLCMGAHCDDIPIGCGGAILKLSREYQRLDVSWVVFSSTEIREKEEQIAADRFLANVQHKRIIIRRWRDGFLPQVWGEVKDFVESIKDLVEPDLIFTHHERDRHQDHRLISELTWNTFRNHLILEYEIPKYDGDFGSPNVFIPLSDEACNEKVSGILDSYRSQKDRQWFTENLFLSTARIRGMESGGKLKYAEGFYARKIVLGPDYGL